MPKHAILFPCSHSERVLIADYLVTSLKLNLQNFQRVLKKLKKGRGGEGEIYMHRRTINGSVDTKKEQQIPILSMEVANCIRVEIPCHFTFSL